MSPEAGHGVCTQTFGFSLGGVWGGGGEEQRSHMYSLAGYIYIYIYICMSANMSFKTLKNMQFLPGRVYILILVFALVQNRIVSLSLCTYPTPTTALTVCLA